MAIYKWSTETTSIYDWSTPLTAVYKGSTKIRPTGFSKKIEDSTLDSHWTPAIWKPRTWICIRWNNLYLTNYSQSTIYSMLKANYISWTGMKSKSSTPCWGITVSEDETKVLIGDYDNNRIKIGTMNTTWDVSSISSFTATNNLGNLGIRDICCKPDGTKIYVASHYSGNILEYPLGTAWDLSSIGNPITKVVAGNNLISAVSFSPDGKYIFFGVYNSSDCMIYQRELGTAWDISTVANTDTSSIHLWSVEPRWMDIYSDGSWWAITDPFWDIYWYSW